MPRQSAVPFEEQVESIRRILSAAVRSGGSDRHFDKICYQLIFTLPAQSTCISHYRQESDERREDKGTSDHIYRPEPWGQCFRRRPELLSSLDTFMPFADELRTVCRVMRDENQTVKEEERTKILKLPRSRTRNLYANCGIITYAWAVDYRKTVKEPAFHRVPDFMDELEREILGWI